jgi:hypothetical protein
MAGDRRTQKIRATNSKILPANCLVSEDMAEGIVQFNFQLARSSICEIAEKSLLHSSSLTNLFV